MAVDSRQWAVTVDAAKSGEPVTGGGGRKIDGQVAAKESGFANK